MKEAVVISSIWANQSWFPLLLESLVNLLTIQKHKHFSQQPTGGASSVSYSKTMQDLPPGEVSGLNSKIHRGFCLRKLSRSSALHGDIIIKNPIHLPGQYGFAVAVKGVLVPFKHL